MRWWWVLGLALAACKDDPKSDDDTDVEDTDFVDPDDLDGDGFSVSEGDCDDDNPAVYPGAEDAWYDGLDADCLGNSDFDVDGDGDDDVAYGGDDCNDADPDTYVGAPEVWYDGVDQDCLGGSDHDQDGDGEDAPSGGGFDCDDLDATAFPGGDETWYDGVDGDCSGGSDFDQDGDGVDQDLDCDDLDPGVNPSAIDTWYDGVDQDCSGGSDYDQDGDGYDLAFDCDDLDTAVNPSAAEVWYDGVDQDCMGGSDYDQDGDGFDLAGDCDDTDAGVNPDATETWYDGVDGDCSGGSDFDQDGDGFVLAADCDDTDAAVNPDATETWYDGADQDCSGGSDFDQDGDGYDFDPSAGPDCVDTDPDIRPDADELCNGIDDNCDARVDEDEAIDAPTWYVDVDGDGFGVEPVVACDQPVGAVADDGDCDDDDQTTFPGAPAVACDGVENDCDPTPLEVGGGFRVGGTLYTTLSSALTAGYGGTVEVCEGRHVVDLTLVTGGVVLWGPWGRDVTVLDGAGQNGILDVRTTERVGLEGLTLTGGTGVRAGPAHRGGAVAVGDGGELSLQACFVEGNAAGDGAGLWAGEGASITLGNTEVRDNVGSDDVVPVPFGGGVYLSDGATLFLFDSSIHNNDASACGGVALAGAGSIIGGGVAEIHRNTADLGGGGVCGSTEPIVLQGLNIHRNDAAVGGGVDAWDVTIRDCTVDRNAATLNGGGLNVVADLFAERTVISNNDAAIDGGGVALSGDATLTACTVTGNAAEFFAAYAGGVRVDGGTLTSIDTDWGSVARDNPPGDVGLADDQMTFNFTGVQSFVCDDGSGLGCQ
jgi:hypothetical protein